ncbi:PrsW family intramembrane metalloprotease [Saccharomonospora sp. NPDC006951]
MSKAVQLDRPEQWPVGVDGFIQPRRAAFWVYLSLVAVGVVTTVSSFFDDYRLVPTAVFVGIVIWVLYGLVFLAFFRSLDLFEQHPPLGFVMAFCWGAFAATYLAISANQSLLSIISKLGDTGFADEWGAALVGPTIEETLKLCGVLLLILIARSQFRTIVSVVVVGALVGLGFQILEDLSYSVRAAVQFPTDEQITPVIQIFFVRGVLSGLWSHALYTSIAAFGIGYFITRTYRPLAARITVAVASFALAWFVHFFWNSPWLTDLFGDNPLGALAQIVLRGIPILLIGFAIWWLAGRDESTHLRVLADHYVSDALISDDERKGLTSLRYRRHLRKRYRKDHGRKHARTYRALQRRQLRLVMLFGQYGQGKQTEEAGVAVRALRAKLPASTT